MRRIFLLFQLAYLLVHLPLSAQPESKTERDARMAWWREARFGMFIHWGLYAIPAGEWDGKTDYGEWIRHSARIPLETYDRFQTRFNPVKFNADEWVRTAKDAGMKYIVITSKHHDGFCMFDTKQTGFNIIETPFGRDVMKELAVACRKYGLKLCFYYSIMDWHHPDYLPRRDWETCMTMNDHWGYNNASTNYKSAQELIRMLTDIASKGGNYLLNVGPTGKGTFPKQVVSRLKKIGKWMTVNGESIYGTVASPFTSTPWGCCTMKESQDTVTLYLHLFDWPADGRLVVDGCLNEPLQALLLAEPEKKLIISREDDKILVLLPKKAPEKLSPVVKLTLLGPLDITNAPDIVANNDLFVDLMKLELVSDRPNVEIRFTGDGTDPVDTSFLYREPLEIRGAVTVKARCFRDGKPVSGTATRSFTMLLPLAPKNVENPTPGIRYQYFEGEWDSLPDFSKLTPVKSGHLPYFTFDPRNEQERFGFVYSGYILIPKRSLYTFYTESDDGSRLYIGRKLVVDNDGLHGLRQKDGSIGLTAGFHPIRVTFFEKTGSDELKVYVRSLDLPKQMIPEEWLVY